MSIHIYVRTHIIHIMICIYIYCLFVYTYTHIAYCTCECTWLMYIYIRCILPLWMYKYVSRTDYPNYVYVLRCWTIWHLCMCIYIYIYVCVLYTYLWFFLFSYDKNNMYVHYIDIVRVTISYLCWYHLSINDFLYRWILPHVCVYVYIYNVYKILH